MKKIYKIIIFVLLMILFTLIMTVFIMFKGAQKYEGKTLNLKYDNTWITAKSSNNSVSLNHKTGGKLDIKVEEIDNEKVNNNIDEFSSDIAYMIDELDSSYKLIAKSEDKITKKGYDGYKMLYENDNSEILVTIFRKDDMLITVIYTAKNENFDILLDSVNTIVYNMEVGRL